MPSQFTPPPNEDIEACFASKRTDRLPLTFNDIVSVKDGPFKGQEGWIVGLVESAPEPRYTVELCSGKGDLHLLLSEFDVLKRSDAPNG